MDIIIIIQNKITYKVVAYVRCFVLDYILVTLKINATVMILFWLVEHKRAPNDSSISFLHFRL